MQEVFFISYPVVGIEFQNLKCLKPCMTLWGRLIDLVPRNKATCKLGGRIESGAPELVKIASKLLIATKFGKPRTLVAVRTSDCSELQSLSCMNSNARARQL